jgi:hypothetical protein
MSATYEYVHNSYGMGGEGIVFFDTRVRKLLR